MAKSKSALSKRVLSAWTPTPKDPYLWDGHLHGFGVRRNSNGTTTALLGYRNKYGQRRRYKVGRITDTYTITQARDDADDLLTDIGRGADPLGEKQSTRNALNIDQLLDAYLESAKFAGKAESTQYMDKSRIKRHLRPLLGPVKVEQLSRDKVRRLFSDIRDGKTATVEKTSKKRGKARVTGGESVARSSVKLLSAIFTWAIEEGLATENPCKGVNVGQSGVREAILETPEQYKSLFDALDRMQVSNIDPDDPGEVTPIPDAAANAIRVLAFTGARKSEITEARWSWVNIDAGTLTVPPKSHKSGHITGKPKVIPLPSPARAVIESLTRHGEDDFVFPATRGGGGISLPSKMWIQIRKEAGLPDGITNHSLRHSLGTIMAVQGAEAAQIMAALGHSQLSTTQRYIHIARDARAAMVEKYTAGIAAAISPTAEVVDIKKARK
ncbi:tyrosine-type recombinase/integrase [Congregibacter litoralis]|uniref:Site-specific recombinase XerD n=1 Tax=Congregibacter litoralis KT71 TaxID=314285 RepID=A4ACH4_9GAMM|nr:tyrosine-type recombinase/integrase [Congregibacter litoralis]EAQ96402.1 Site-specific recombinase XerD [Congregibacter litoralis KT71]